MMERAEALGERAEDPLVLYSILYGFFIAKFIPFDGDDARALASQFLELAGQQKATALIMIGHRLLGTTLLCLGEALKGSSIWIKLPRFMRPPSIVRSRRTLAMMSARLP
jgi:hypothetical protein